MKSFYLLSLFCLPLAYAQEKIPVKHQKWNFTSFQERSVVRDKKEGILLDNVSLPEIELYKAKGDIKTNKAMVICPGGGLYFLAYEKEGTVQAKKLASKGITAVVLKYRTYPREGNDKHIPIIVGERLKTFTATYGPPIKKIPKIEKLRANVEVGNQKSKLVIKVGYVFI